MEQRDIEIFLTLVDELHFGRAAGRLHVSTARVPIHDALPYERRFLWLSAAETATIRAFDHTAATLAEARGT